MVLRRFAAIGLALLVLVAGVGCDQGPGTAATSAMRAGAAGDAETLRKYLPKDVLEQTKQLPGDMVARLATMMKSSADRRGGLKSLTIVSEKVEGDRATVQVKTVWGDGQEETEDIGLIRSDGRWVLDLMPGRI
jgi:hypothetical protein